MTDNTVKTYYPLPICRGKVGQPRAVMYANGVFKASSELEQMIIAFGPDYMNMLLENSIYKVQTELRNDQRKGLRLTEKKRVRVKANKAA